MTRISKQRLLTVASLLLSKSGVVAYSTDGALAAVRRRSPDLVQIPTSTSSILPKTNNKVSYDLGLGKNAPLVPSNKRNQNILKSTEVNAVQKQHEQPQKVNSAVKFLVEHRAVREYPSPYHQPGTAYDAGKTSDFSEKRKTARVVNRGAVLPTRSTRDDVLKIKEAQRGSSSSESAPAVEMTSLFGVAQQRQLNLNTPWVEMLIHEQQREQRLALQ